MRVAPPNFGYIEEGIFRCGLPEPRHYSFLASLHLRTCVLLTERVDVTFLRWLNESGVRVICPLLSAAATSCVASPTGPLPVVLLTHPSNSNNNNSNNNNNNSNSGGAMPATLAQTMGSAEQQLRALRAAALDEAAMSPVYTTNTSSLYSNVSYATAATGADRASGAPSRAWASDGSVSVSAAQMPAIVSVPRFASGATMTSGASAATAAVVTTATDAHSTTTLVPSLASTSSSTGAGATTSATAASPPLRVYTSGSAAALSPQQAAVASALPQPSQQQSSPLLYCNTMLYSNNNGSSNSCNVVSSLSAQGTLSEPVVVDLLRLLLDPQNYPLLLTGAKGRFRTGIVCGCLRKLQRWNVVSILEEYRRYAGDKSRAEHEEFIELFDKDLVSLDLDGGRRPTILYDH